MQRLLGKALYHANKLREASKALNFATVLTRRPDPKLHCMLGLVYLRQAEPEKAMREAKAALDLAPRFHAARKLLSDAYVMNNDLARAEEELGRYMRTVRTQNDALPIKERLEAISTLRKAKDWQSVQKPVTAPRILDIPKPKYTDAAFRNRVEGMVKMEVLFGSNAVVRQVILVRELGFGLDERAIEAARAITFTPGESDGKPVSIWTGVVMHFVLEDAEKQGKGLPSKYTEQ